MTQAIGPFSSGAAAGGNGVATANATSGATVTGALFAVYVRYNDSPPATTDVTIETTGGVMPGRVLLTLTDANTSGYFALTAAEYKADGTASSTYGVPFLVGDKIKVTIAGANAADSVDVWLVVE